MSRPIKASESVDGQLWWALRDANRLAGMARPTGDTNFREIQMTRELDVIVSLVGDNDYDCFPLERTIVPLEDLYASSGPSNPISELSRVAKAAVTVRELLDERRGVLVHCEGGIGRTGTVIGAVLVSYGLSPHHAAAWLDDVHRLRGYSGWPESPWQREALGAVEIDAPEN